jgi:hypothetical protein
MTETYGLLNAQWKATCRIVFGQEVGELRDFEPYLLELTRPVIHHKSCLSGKGVVSAPAAYCKNSRWLALDEVDFSKPGEPLNINEIKDLDSIVDALSERFCYTGSITFGKCACIEQSSNINDSVGIYKAARYGHSRNIACCTMAKDGENCFGLNGASETSFSIKCNRSFHCTRSFELWMSDNSQDSFYSSGLTNCSNCMFSFNSWNRKYAIGNFELPKDKYLSIKSALLSEVTEWRKHSKRAPTLLDIVKKSKWAKPQIPAESERIDASDTKDKTKIEEAFSKTASLLLGKPLNGGIDAYSEYLCRHTQPTAKCKSAASGKEMVMPTFSTYPLLPKDRLLDINEAQVFGQSIRLERNDAEGITLENAHEKIGPLAFFHIYLIVGKNTNLIECVNYVSSANSYRSSAVGYSKYCAYSFWPMNSQYLFGADSPFNSSFCINTYSSTSQTRCFETDCCGYCTDTYFSHNCENTNDSMFCFNKKNLRYAIGNATMPQNDYKKVKSALLAQIADELNSTKDLRYDIYNIACAKA